MSDIEARVKKIIAEQLGVPEADVTNEKAFVADLGADSLDTVELVMAWRTSSASRSPTRKPRRSPPCSWRSTTRSSTRRPEREQALLRVVSRRVVVTGLGSISPVGNTVAEGWANLVAGRSGIGPSRSSTRRRSRAFAGEVQGLQRRGLHPRQGSAPHGHLHPLRVAASIQAVQRRRPADRRRADRRGGRAHRLPGRLGHRRPADDRGNAREYRERGPRRISPFFVPARSST
jgi:hypothetical protein